MPLPKNFKRSDLVLRELVADKAGRTRLDDERLDALMEKVIDHLFEKAPADWSPQEWAIFRVIWNDKKTQKIEANSTLPEPEATSQPTPPSTTTLMTSGELEAFFDGDQ